MLDQNFLSLDLELNKPSNKIIQVGAVVGNLKSGEILEKLSVYVNPNEKLDPFIIKLTGIKQEDVDRGETLWSAYTQLASLQKFYDCFINPLTWGGGDSEELKNQIENPDNERWIFGRRWIDVKTLYISYRLFRGRPPVGGLAKALTKFGLKFEGKKHNACYDALNTFLIYRRLLQEFSNYNRSKL